MKINWPQIGNRFNGVDLTDLSLKLKEILRSLDYAFSKIRPDDQISIGGGTFIKKHLSKTVTLNFSAPGAVPGIVSLTAAFDGVALGDQVQVSSAIAWPSGFTLHGFVSAVDEVTIRWAQHSGGAADPDAAGTTYRIDVWKH